jgi:hypothetical protein
MAKNERAAIKADGFEYSPWSIRSIRNCREGLRYDIADRSYFADLAPTVIWVPDYLVAAWAELYDDEVDLWMHILHEWPCRDLRYINNAGDLVQEFISLATCGHTRRSMAEACHG